MTTRNISRKIAEFLGSNPKRQQRNNSKAKRPLSMETLGDRRLLAADISLNAGILEIDADGHNDDITVENYSAPFITNAGKGSFLGGLSFTSVSLLQYKVTVHDMTTGGIQTEYFNPLDVDRIDISGGAGNDVIDVLVDRPAIIDGGIGWDWIYGGPQDDILYGGSSVDRMYGRGGSDQMFGQGGSDYMYGGNGDDRLEGSSGMDRLYGQNGNDVLLGGSSTDYLYGGNHDDELRGGTSRDYLRGQSGNDRLIGDSGNDDLEGSTGNDVLIGGTGSDDMHSGTGLDRFLVTVGEGDDVEDKSSADARINFINTTSDIEVVLGSNFGETTAEADSWSTAEIEEVDESLQLLFDTTGNNHFLKKSDGSDLRLVRYGDIFDSNGNEQTTVLGWNGGTDIVMINNAFERGRVMETVVHEVGHNFDEQHENQFIDEFQDASGWEYIPFWGSTAGMTVAEDDSYSNWYGGWYFETSRADEFARDYGQMNLKEDFATSFTAKILTDAGLNYFNEAASSVQSRMTARFDVLDDFFASV